MAIHFYADEQMAELACVCVDRTYENQRYRASGLNLVVAAIVLWNTVYLQKAIRTKTEAGNPVPEDLIPHLSPLGWEHITFTGSYDWREHASDINVLRPLRTFKLLNKKRKTA